ncbi:hypothetical protein QNH14_15475 [Apirhabdus apintestini]|nr:hypothetical protein QNH14_15475 [Enterobacteriaceae bacterium CA-0114]
MFKEFVTAVPMQIKNKDAQQVLLQWFDDLSERGVYGKEENNKPPKRLNGRAWRAELKRVDPPGSNDVRRLRYSASAAVRAYDANARSVNGAGAVCQRGSTR